MPTLPRPATIVDVLRARAAESPQALAYSAERADITYAELLADAQGTAVALAARGVKAGDHCGLVLGTGIEFIRSFFAIQLLGGAPVAINPSFPAATALERLRQAGCRFALASGPTLEALWRANGGGCELVAVEALLDERPRRELRLPGPTGADTAYLQITSGTTGEPRAAAVPHRSLMACLELIATALSIRPDDVFVSWLPLHHDLGLVRFVCLPLFCGRPSHLITPAIRNLRGWLETISRVRGTITASPDFGFRIATRTVSTAGLNLESLRIATNGGEPVRLGTIEAFEAKFGLPGVVRPAYGLAEATLSVSCLLPGEPLRCDPRTGAVSCGRPYPGVQVEIVDATGAPVTPGEPGEIVVRSDVVFAGYFGDPASTAVTLRDGALHTGDVGLLDADGHLHVLGRSRALIKRAGAAIAPREVEEAVDRVAHVRFSAAVGIADEALGGSETLVVVAEVQPEPGLSPGTVTDAIVLEVSRTLGFAPGDVILVTPRTIPRTHNGKIRYGELRRMIVDGELARAGSVLLSGVSDRRLERSPTR
ncbi:MAG: AMP-binding protein [Candidatus Rokubacteria bacterium]|nr:AMP-binding protein [Candidatus Rokubacteria bacterium]